MEKNYKGTKGDMYTKEIIQRILDEGCMDLNPRPKYSDGTAAHTLSVNHGICTYDLSKGESPLITLRPVAIKSAIGELLWIYRDKSNDLNLLRDKYNVRWWDQWDIGNRTNGKSYGETIRQHYSGIEISDDDFIIEQILKDPDGRRHSLNMWQVQDFKYKHGLKPCAFLTMWNIRRGKDGINYLDMCLIQRSSDFLTAGCINQTQYVVFQYLIAKELTRKGLYVKPGRFTWFYNNIQIYDRHFDQAHEMLRREPIDCSPMITIDDDVTWETVMPENVHVTGYPIKEIKEKNPQLKFDLGI